MRMTCPPWLERRPRRQRLQTESQQLGRNINKLNLRIYNKSTRSCTAAKWENVQIMIRSRNSLDSQSTWPFLVDPSEESKYLSHEDVNIRCCCHFNSRRENTKIGKTVQVIKSPDSSAVFDPSVPTKGNADEPVLQFPAVVVVPLFAKEKISIKASFL